MSLNQTAAQTILKQAESLIEIYGYCHIDYFASQFLPHYITASFAPHHLEIFDCIQRGELGIKKNIVAPRGSAKSTCMARIYPLHRICYKHYDELMGHAPDTFILLLSRTHTIAIQHIKAIKYELEVNEAIRTAFGDLTGATWGEKEIVTANGVNVKSLGRGGQVRGSLFRNYRPTLIISDDLDDPETVNNPDVREKDQLWFDTDLSQAGSIEGTTNFINIDTIKHKHSITSVLRDRPEWDTHFFQAIPHPENLWHPTAEEKWKQWEGLYTDLSIEKRERDAQADAFYQQHKAEMHGAEIKELWGEMKSYLDVRKEICDKGYFPVMRELQNNPVDRSQAFFEMDKALRFSVQSEGFLRSDNVFVEWHEMSGASVFLDWAGGKDLADNCFACVVGVVWVPMPTGTREERQDSLVGGVNGYVLYDWLDKVGPTEQITACLDMYEKVKSGVRSRNFKILFGIEDFVRDTFDAQKQVITRDFINQRDKRNIDGRLGIRWVNRNRNKFDRIDELHPPIINKHLAFNYTLSAEFMNQLSDYPTGDFVDAPDALEGACQLRVTQFESERQERRQRLNRQRENFRVEI